MGTMNVCHLRVAINTDKSSVPAMPFYQGAAPCPAILESALPLKSSFLSRTIFHVHYFAQNWSLTLVWLQGTDCQLKVSTSCLIVKTIFLTSSCRNIIYQFRIHTTPSFTLMPSHASYWSLIITIQLQHHSSKTYWKVDYTVSLFIMADIIHTVGPTGEQPAQLHSCYSRCLSLMHKHKLKTIAFPCISTGIYGKSVKCGLHVEV